MKKRHSKSCTSNFAGAAVDLETVARFLSQRSRLLTHVYVGCMQEPYLVSCSFLVCLISYHVACVEAAWQLLHALQVLCWIN